MLIQNKLSLPDWVHVPSEIQKVNYRIYRRAKGIIRYEFLTDHNPHILCLKNFRNIMPYWQPKPECLSHFLSYSQNHTRIPQISRSHLRLFTYMENQQLGGIQYGLRSSTCFKYCNFRNPLILLLIKLKQGNAVSVQIQYSKIKTSINFKFTF